MQPFKPVQLLLQPQHSLRKKKKTRKSIFLDLWNHVSLSMTVVVNGKHYRLLPSLLKHYYFLPSMTINVMKWHHPRFFCLPQRSKQIKATFCILSSTWMRSFIQHQTEVNSEYMYIDALHQSKITVKPFIMLHTISILN